MKKGIIFWGLVIIGFELVKRKIKFGYFLFKPKTNIDEKLEK
jgi:hypothetical protein